MCLDQGVWVVCSLGDPDRPLGVVERLGEATEMRERQPEPRPRPSRKKHGQLGSTDHTLVRERMNGFYEEDGGLRQVAHGEMCLSQTILRLDLETRVRQLGGDVEGLSARIDGPLMVTHVPKSRPDVGQDQAQTAPVTELSRQGFSLAHVLQDPPVLTERGEHRSRVEPEVDGLGGGLAAHGQACEDAKGLLERVQGLAVRGTARGADASLAEVGDRPVPEAATEGMVGEHLHMLSAPVAVESLDRRHDARMQLTTPLLE